MAACTAGVPTILFEAGEALKVEPWAVSIGVRGVLNVLFHLGMLIGEPERPAYQTTSQRTSWVRAHAGGLLRFHVSPGDVVDAGQHIASVDNFFAEKSEAITAPADGVIIGMPTMPAVKPGDPVCHIAQTSLPNARIRGDLAQSAHRRPRPVTAPIWAPAPPGRRTL
jgi:predicted deacylase